MDSVKEKEDFFEKLSKKLEWKERKKTFTKELLLETNTFPVTNQSSRVVLHSEESFYPQIECFYFYCILKTRYITFVLDKN